MTTHDSNHNEYLKLVKHLLLNTREVSVLCGVHKRTVERWAAGSRKVSNTTINYLDICWMVKRKYPRAWRDLMIYYFEEEDKRA